MILADFARLLAGLRSRAFGIRGQSALLAALAVGVALSVGALGLLAVFQRGLESNLDQTLLQQARDRIRLIDQGTEPTSLTDALRDESMVWIGSATGEEIAAGGSITPAEPLVLTGSGNGRTIEILVNESHDSEREIESDDGEEPDVETETERATLRVASATSTDGSIVVVAGSEIEHLGDTVGQVAGLFFTAIPVVMLLVGTLTWFNTSRALKPVERIRRRAAEVTGSNLAERVPEPETDDEIRQLAVTMNDMLSRLDSHQKAQLQFTADASHELKSPVANMRALLDTARIQDPRWDSLRDRLTSEADRLRDLVDNLLYLASHADGGSPTPERSEVNLDDLLFDEAELLSSTGNVDVDIDGVTPVVVTGNGRDLKRLVRNLVDNAARHAQGRVILACLETADSVVLQVGDDGDGIPEHERARVFERFTRLDDARARDTGGSGLGLTIVRQIAEDHGATIRVGTSPAGGAQMDVLFMDRSDEKQDRDPVPLAPVPTG